MKNKKDSSIFSFISIIAIFCLLSFTKLTAQQNHNWFASVSQDVKMSYEGAHGEGGKLNPEITLGIDFDTFRISTKYEWFKSIQYKKWSYLALDYKPRLIRNERIETLIGLEASVIWRYDPLIDHYNDNISIGGNLELVYWLTDNIGLFANYNVFTAEAYDNFLNKMKPIRTDVRIGLTYKI